MSSPLKRETEKQRIDRLLNPFPPTERQNLRRTLTQYRKGTCSKWGEEKLISAGLVGTSIAESRTSPTVDNQRALADTLHSHFYGRLNIEITQAKICHWAKGTHGHGVPNGSPPAPPRQGHRYVIREWVEWVERVILPTHSQNGHSQGVPREPTKFELAQEAQAELNIIDLRRAKRAEEIDLGNFVPIQEHIARLKTVGQVLNQAVTDSIEKTMIQTIMDAAKVLPIDEIKMAEFRQVLQQACETAADAQRTALAGAMMQATDKNL